MRQDEKQAICEYPSCAEKGEYPAPRSRHKSDGYKLFCLKHVRDYNRSWNYFSDMNVNQVNSYNRQAAVWMKPTWPLGRVLPAGYGRVIPFLAELCGFKTDGERRWQTKCPNEVKEAMRLFDIEAVTSLKELKARYRLLVKSNHPDVHRGKKLYIKKVQAINSAYARLKTWHLKGN